MEVRLLSMAGLLTLLWLCLAKMSGVNQAWGTRHQRGLQLLMEIDQEKGKMLVAVGLNGSLINTTRGPTLFEQAVVNRMVCFEVSQTDWRRREIKGQKEHLRRQGFCREEGYSNDCICKGGVEMQNQKVCSTTMILDQEMEAKMAENERCFAE
ncbi:hypothetical protein SUGI_0771730 [Cryptomeria japonica]|nr:hypothetical protein SUGI_0771730 [Cryptomeria japonica]